MKNKTTRLLAMLLTLIMLLTACGQPTVNESTSPTSQTGSTKEPTSAPTADATQGTEAPDVSEYPEYLNLDGPYPIVKDEYAEDITLTLLIGMQDAAAEWDELWISKYLSEKYNVNFEVEYVSMSGSARKDRKSLMFAANELPDLMINLGFSTAELVKYGAVEGQLLPLDSYMNETLTPNILKYMVGDVKASCTATDGHIYTLPYLQNVEEPNSNATARMFIKSKWLEDLGMEMPKTLDDFVDVLYAIKEADPAGVGSEELYPLVGGMDTLNASWFILNAMGYNGYKNSGYGYRPMLRDGEVVVPVYDMDIFKEYLALMNQFYNDGIIAPTYFTIDKTEINSYVINGQTAMYPDAPYLAGNEDWADYECLSPLTSKWQTEPEIATTPSATIGNFAISADTEYPELCLRIADAFFNNTDDYCAALYGGYGIDSEWSFGYLQREYLPEFNSFEVDPAKAPNNMSTWDYLVQYTNGGAWNLGAHALPESIERLVALQGNPDYVHKLGTAGKDSWRISVGENMIPYQTAGYPTITYDTEEISERKTELETVLHPYIKEQVALFITGKRPLSEVYTFKEELKGMGMEELLTIYTDTYSSYAQ